jgi:hypothetical protein
MHLTCINIVVAPATYTCPIVPRGLRRGVFELRTTAMVLGSRIAHRGAGVLAGAAVITRRSAIVNGRSRCGTTVLDWP